MRQRSDIDMTPRLSDLVEDTVLAELCRHFVSAENLGIRVVDAAGHQLAHRDHCMALWEYLLSDGTARTHLSAFINRLKSSDISGTNGEVYHEPFTDTYFAVYPIEYEFETLGRVIIGPFRSEPVSTAERTDTTLDDERLKTYLDALFLGPASSVHRKTDIMRTSLEIVCHAGYRVFLTSHIHLDAIAEASAQLEEANQALEARNAALAANVNRLRELDDLKSQFLATVSHELRTPLTSIIGYSEMLLEGLAGDLNSEQRDYVRTVRERGDNLLQMIGNLLDISTIQRGGASLDLSLCVVEDIIEDALSTVRPQAFKGKIVLRMTIEDELPDVQADEQKLRQILVNLLGNAVKFTPPDGRVTIAARRARLPRSGVRESGSRPGILFTVTDTGVGIPSEHLNRIFDAFYQVDNTATRKYGGTGLGLSIAKSFVDSHGGRLKVTSAVHHGSEFSFTLPLEQALGDERP